MANTYLGVEFGSTRIKAMTIDAAHRPASSGDYTWQSSYENGVWTYALEEVWAGLKAALSGLEGREEIAGAGISGMMHGYLAFDIIQPVHTKGDQSWVFIGRTDAKPKTPIVWPPDEKS